MSRNLRGDARAPATNAARRERTAMIPRLESPNHSAHYDRMMHRRGAATIEFKRRIGYELPN